MAVGEKRNINQISQVSWTDWTAMDVYYWLDHSFQYSRNINTDDELHWIKLSTKAYFTEYYAPDYSPALGQFVQQNQKDKVAIGNYPIASVYANFLLKQTRFYVKYYHANEGLGNRNYFLVPHYPTTQGALWLGLSWNFYNW